jgi:hypothetical protein
MRMQGVRADQLRAGAIIRRERIIGFDLARGCAVIGFAGGILGIVVELEVSDQSGGDGSGENIFEAMQWYDQGRSEM